jgi:DNA polymerase-3 subunit beta
VKFQVNRDALSEAVSFVSRLLPQRAPMLILTGILIEADANALRLSVFDYEVSAQVEIVAKVEGSGRVLVSGRLLNDIASKLPNAPVEIELEGNKVNVKCGAAKFSLATMPIETYPPLPEMPPVAGTVPGEDFQQAVAQILPAVSKEDVTPQLNGVLIEAGDKALTLLATDRYRVAMRDVSWKPQSSAIGSTSLVPSRILSEVAKNFSHQGDIQIGLNVDSDKEIIGFSANNRSVTTILMKGTFPPVKSLFPADIADFAIITTQDLVDSAKRVGLVLEKESPIKFDFKDGSVTLDASGNETAQASESISAELSGKEIVVSLKPQFLIEGLAGVHSEFVKIAFTPSNDPNKPGPVLIASHGSKEKTDSDTYRYLLQPNLLNR